MFPKNWVIESGTHRLEGGNRKRDRVLMTLVVVSCLLRSTLEEPGSSITEPGTGRRFKGRFDDSKREKMVLN